MRKNKKIFFYITYIAAITCILLYYLFPSTMIQTIVADSVSRANPDFSIITGKAAPVLPPGLKLRDVTLKRFDVALLNIPAIKLKPVLRSFFKPETQIIFEGRTGGGTFGGTAVIPRKNSTDRPGIDIHCTEVQIREIPGVQSFSKYPTTGLLSGRLTLDKGRGPRINAHADINLASAAVSFPTPVFGLGSVSFQYVEGAFTLAGRRLQVKKCTFTGSQIDGTITGTILLKKPFEKSTLRLNGSIQPHPEFMTQLGQGVAGMVLPQLKSDKEGLTFKIRGILDDPKFSF